MGVFTDGTKLGKDVVVWNEGEPNNANEGEDCARFEPGFDFKLNDMPCDAPSFYICSLPEGGSANEGCGYEGFMVKTKSKGKKEKIKDGEACDCETSCKITNSVAWTWSADSQKCQCYNKDKKGKIKAKKSKGDTSSHNKSTSV